MVESAASGAPDGDRAALIPLCLGYAIGVGYQPGGVNDDLVSDVSLLAFAEYEAYSDAN